MILLVGGTDPSGGAGLLADAKAVAAMGAHGCCAVTAITVQDSGRVYSWSPVSPGQISAQMQRICDDGPLHGMKTGMLGSPGAVEAVSDAYRNRIFPAPLVVDPVLAAGSGDSLSGNGLSENLLKHLVPHASLLTPNLDEAEALTGRPVRTLWEMEHAGRILLDYGARAVLVKGGHLEGEPSDVLVTGKGVTVFPGSRIVPGKVHGTGCTLASACAALMASGHDPASAVPKALTYLRGAIRDGFRREGGFLIGHFPGVGPGPKTPDKAAFYSAPRFCPVCGGNLLGVHGHMECRDCGLVHYRNPLPAVMVLTRDNNGKVLLVRRAFPPAMGELCLPGGFMDLDETPEECARRELQEETGLTADSMELAGADRDSTAYGGVALYVFRATGLHGTPVPGDDASEVLWLAPCDIPPLAFPAHDRVLGRGTD
ncbi:MAG: bifunctional hydroxymethylpyrimidine kinase/phosphomethylpyrimidine kinase [Candidatus Fermentibacteraceae bacterium]